MSANLERVATLVRELADITARVLQDRLKLPAEQASDIGLEVSQAFCNEFGGEVLYIPTGYAARIEERDRAMYQLFIQSQRDIRAVAREFSVSIHTAYRRVALVEAAEFAARQPQLFEDQ